jgi:heptosyltransferase I
VGNPGKIFEPRSRCGNPVDLCIVLLSGLGDVVLGLPVVNALKRDDARRRVTWVVEPMPSGILRHHPAVDDVVVYRKRPALRGARELWRDLRERRFDTTLNFNIYLKGIPPTVFSRAPLRVGFARPRSRDLAWLALNCHVVPRRHQHFVDDFLQFLEPLDIPPPIAPEWRICFTAAERAAQREFFARLGGRPVATIIPASGRPAKDWLAERWAEVAQRLDREHGFRVVLSGGPGAREGALARAIAGAVSPPPIVALGDDVRRLAWILDGSRLVLGPDTGPVHVARALDVPVIGLYGHTNPRHVGPYRAFEDLWVDAYTDPGAAPDPAAHAGKTGRMERISVDAVLERVERALARYPRARGEARGGAA